jgi:hypothetical protein
MSAAVKPSQYPIVESSRSFRLWDANNKIHIPRRCYSIRINAHKAALWEATIAKVGITIEVYNSLDGQLLGQYTRKVNEVQIYMRRGELSAQA